MTRSVIPDRLIGYHSAAPRDGVLDGPGMYFDYFWTPSIIAHLDEHGINQAEFESIVENPVRRGFSKTSGLPAAWDLALAGGI